MKETHTLIVGASFSGLACAATLHKLGVAYTIIEKTGAVASPWRNHYDRLHLHTNKALSSLPYKTFDIALPRYPSRNQVIDYAEHYQKEFNIDPIFNTEATSIRREGTPWVTTTNNDIFRSRCVVFATGAYSKPKTFKAEGLENFPGKLLHSSEYKTGKDFKGKEVLVIGFGNSAQEIAIDLYEQGVTPTVAVRSPVNIIPREFLGIPILRISYFMSMLPPVFADAINDPLMRLLFGDLTKLGLRKMSYGTFQQIQRDGTIPVIDIGIVKLIKQGRINVKGNLDRITGRTVHFQDGSKKDFDVIVAGTGYYTNYAEIIEVDQSRFDDLKLRSGDQKFFGKDGLYFCGFWVGPNGLLNEISREAKKIAKDIKSNFQSF